MADRFDKIRRIDENLLITSGLNFAGMATTAILAFEHVTNPQVMAPIENLAVQHPNVTAGILAVATFSVMLEGLKHAKDKKQYLAGLATTLIGAAMVAVLTTEGAPYLFEQTLHGPANWEKWVAIAGLSVIAYLASKKLSDNIYDLKQKEKDVLNSETAGKSVLIQKGIQESTYQTDRLIANSVRGQLGRRVYSPMNDGQDQVERYLSNLWKTDPKKYDAVMGIIKAEGWG